jgi:hypothetical protein
MILHSGRGYGVGLSTETEAARHWREVKDGRHAALPVPILDLYAKSDRYRVGDFWLHPPEDVDLVEAFIARQEAEVFEAAQQALWQVYASTPRRPKCSRQDFADGFHGALAYLRAALTGRDQRHC